MEDKVHIKVHDHYKVQVHAPVMFIVTCFIKGNLPECSFNEYFDLIF